MTARITTYPGKINSTASTLSAIALIGDTTISVTDASVLPTGPNLAVLGTGVDAETILYDHIDGNDLHLVTRSFQGSAKQWAATTVIKRAFTAYDYDSLRQNQDIIIDELPRSPIFTQSIINGNFDIWQRGTTFTTPNDDTFGPDRWLFVMDGNGAWTLSKETTIFPSGSTASLKCVNVTENKQFGLVYLMESVDAKKLAGKHVSLSFQAYTTAGWAIGKLRCAVLAWSSTADAMTSDVVAAWDGAGSNPTFAANYTAENTPADLTLVGDTWTLFETEGIDLDTASTANLAVFIWTDDTTITAADEFYLAQVQLNIGDIAIPFQAPDYTSELRKCQRYYYRLAADKAYTHFAAGFNTSTTAAFVMRPHPVSMRIAPTIAASTTANQFAVFHAATNTALSAVPADNNSSIDTLSLTATVASGLTAGQGSQLQSANSTAPWINCSAEL